MMLLFLLYPVWGHAQCILDYHSLVPMRSASAALTVMGDNSASYNSVYLGPGRWGLRGSLG